MAVKYTNNATSTLAADITGVVTTLSVTAGDGALFPVLGVGDTCTLTVQDSTGNYEIMQATARVGDTFTVVRGYESTTPRSFSSGAIVMGTLTAGSISNFASTSYVDSTVATKQPLDATLTALAGVTTAADKLIYATASDTFTTTDLTAAGRALLDDASASAQRTTLGLAIGTDVQAYDANTAKINIEQDWTKAQTFTPVAITSSGGALAVDTDLHQVATCTLSENTTVSAATNQKNGRAITLIFTGASTYTLAWNANWKRNSDFDLPTATAAGKTLRVIFVSDGTYMWMVGRAYGN